MTKRNEHAVRTRQEIADILGAVPQSISESEARAMRKLRELFTEDDFPETQRSVVMGKWNGRKIVRVR